MPNEKVAFRPLILKSCMNADFVAGVQQELLRALENLVAVKRSTRLAAQATLMIKAPLVQTEITQKIQQNEAAFDQKAINEGWSGREKKRQSNKAVFEKKFVIRHEVADPVVQGFEVSYKATRTNKEEIHGRIRQAAEYINAVSFVDCRPNRGAEDNWIVSVFSGDAWIPAIELWFGDARFIKTATPNVFVHRTNPGRHYVQDRNGFFVARYLIRNMSTFDRTKVVENPKPEPILKAKNPIIPKDEDLITAVTTHVRAKEASGGDTCFLSFSHTKHSIVGSSAALFYKQENGDVIVDASKVDRNTLVDVHSLAAVKKIFGVVDVVPTMPFVEGSEAYEANAAARDTVRTREILIAASVPQAAVIAVRLSTATVKAPWTDLAGIGTILPDGIPIAWLA